MEASAKIPMMIVGDSPTGHSGLGRILKEVAASAHTFLSDTYEVATLGLGTPPSPDLPFQQFPAMRVSEWMLHDLPWTWRQFSKGREGVIFFIWDISRLLWVAFPDQCPDEELKKFWATFKGQKWLYPAVDGCGPTGGLPVVIKDAIRKFDRVLNYTRFSAGITGYPDVCLHGIDTKVFYPRHGAREQVKSIFHLDLAEDEKLIGIVATNQPRKDWAMAMGALAILKQRGIKAKVWIHTDVDNRHWDLKSLYVEFGLEPDIKVFLTPYGIPDDMLAVLYSACDATMGIGPEGFGYPIAESLCCGTPCVTGEYGGQSDFVPPSLLVTPKAYRYEGVYGVMRPVYDSADFARKLERLLRRPSERKVAKPVCSWETEWPKWEKWFRAGGINGVRTAE